MRAAEYLGDQVINEGANVGGVPWDNDGHQLLGTPGSVQPSHQALQGMSNLDQATLLRVMLCSNTRIAEGVAWDDGGRQVLGTPGSNQPSHQALQGTPHICSGVSFRDKQPIIPGNRPPTNKKEFNHPEQSLYHQEEPPSSDSSTIPNSFPGGTCAAASS